MGSGEAGGAEVGVRAARLKGSNTWTQIGKMLGDVHRCFDAGALCSARHRVTLSDHLEACHLACRALGKVQKQVSLKGKSVGSQTRAAECHTVSSCIIRCTPPLKSSTH